MTVWQRQMLFLKDADPKGPNYFVLRDGFEGTPTEPTQLNLWFLAKSMQRESNLFHYDGQCLVDMDVFVNTSTTFEPNTDKYGPTQEPYRRLMGFDPQFHPDGKLQETQLLLRIQQPPGRGYMVVLYPRLKEGEPPATFARLSENVVKVETPVSTDYAFLSPSRFSFNDEKVEFDGMAASVRYCRSGKVSVSNAEGRARFVVAGTLIEGSGGFVVTLDRGKVSKQTYGEGATVKVEE
ncbi:MAG: hypothetical protein COS85_23475 [Armatimonadetes bacterium CG07_land_8_20_14_0_80_59_28]|nr:MAG: hypothetical protein COS85_23475 [Armatimonadetes bacterium CG07_land_8_20_14_0_80_59_28]